VRRAGKIALGFLLILALLFAAAWLYLRKSLPAIDGDVTVRGLTASVEIIRDKDGVPHMFAKNARDGWFAMGYAHAQDRLWQMEFQRRVVDGRLSELLGDLSYDADRLFRTLGIARMAGRIVERMDPDTRANLEAYSAGVNAFLATDPVLPIEFQVFRLDFPAWKPQDSVGWLLIMGWDLSTNWRTELGRMRYGAKLGAQRAADLLPDYPGDTVPPLPDLKTLYASVQTEVDALAAVYPLREESAGSNSWVVSGARSETGKPLLANDPHLGLQAPALWYLAHVSTPEGNMVGGTLPGVPFITIGRNDHVAWTLTAANADTQDVFVERIAPDDETSYITPKGTAKFEVREEVIKVRSEERRLRVRSTRHGPVISDAVKSAEDVAPKGHVLSLAWSALAEDNTAMRAGFAMNDARGYDAFVAAMRDLTSPTIAVVFADTSGRIGFVMPGRVPLRRSDNSAMGRVPVPGWDAKYDWQGFLPFEKLPAVHGPTTGRIVTANHKITPPGYKPFISIDWFPPYRADRIEELLAQRPKHSVDSFRKMQADDVSRLARDLLPVALSVKPSSEAGRRAQAQLQGWKANMSADSRAALVFSAWYRELTRLVYADELGDLFKDGWDLRPAFMISVLKAERGQERWCDDVKTPARETCAEQGARAFDLAAKDLESRYGAIDGWRWGSVHTAASDHRPFGYVPYISRFFNVSPQTAGDTYSINVGHFFIRDEARPFANRHAASMRAIYDLADLDRSLFMQSTGQSGNVLSPWYANFAERWAKVEYIAIPASREAIAAQHRLTLSP
jgi:penicillin G amidase